ncbi:Ger(x)C family spore germination protein [Paenibacillus sp. sptzw28]|uniref:Ger(x)C family spore germination protein n=1 Tax=Paenibacillus sp. sptzw28 TaxID=715179 RepID=UPI001C6F0C8A|nr:Ger(x)C family spore germination protein [Paenibacillus sp. sptzw28]QYR21005.1 Ger(x)C family spore germination protein [Paenibacillus sp. sptzw28]
MRKRLPLLLLCAMVLLLSGCWDRTEVNDVAIILGAAIDRKNDKQIEMSVQIFIPRAFGGAGTGGGGAGGAKMTLVRSGAGNNISDAMAQLQSKLPRRLFWGHCKVIVFGEEAARTGIQTFMDFLLRYPEVRERANMFVSKGKASKTLELIPPLERASSEVIREMSDLRLGMKVTLKDLNGMLTSLSHAAALPMIDILKSRRGEKPLETIPYITGTSILRGGEMVGELSLKKTKGLMWLREEIHVTTVTVPIKELGGFVSLNPIRESTKLIPQIEKGNMKMIVQIRTEGDVIQNGTRYNVADARILKILERNMKEDIRDRMELALHQIQKGFKADVFGFAEEFHRKYPKQWAKVQDRWDTEFPKVEVKFDLDSYIRRPGLITDPAGLPEDKVIKK